jgi:hypothetical protein
MEWQGNKPIGSAMERSENHEDWAAAARNLRQSRGVIPLVLGSKAALGDEIVTKLSFSAQGAFL